MSITTRKNESVKALQSFLASSKKYNDDLLLEWEIACNTNVNRGKVWKQSEIMDLYKNRGWDLDCGASKICHTKNHHGNNFQTIVIKRHRNGGHIFSGHGKSTGNQLIDEIACWNELAETEDADLLCPIMKYFTSKSDKVEATSDKMQENVIIIAQKAVYVANAEMSCKKAEQMNRENGYHGETYETRILKMRTLSKKRGWWDVMRHAGGNCGVIFDYSKNCYKAVIIDYAL